MISGSSGPKRRRARSTVRRSLQALICQSPSRAAAPIATTGEKRTEEAPSNHDCSISSSTACSFSGVTTCTT